MPLTLYWYILRDLLKLLAVSTAVLVIVLSFGFAIKPISEGLLTPVQILRVIFFAAPGMLAFILPFTAALSSTLVFFRLATDNEITACAATGISYRQIATPVVALGLGLSLLLFWMSNWVVPRAWRMVEQQIEQDVTQLIISQVQREGLADLGNGIILYADHAENNVAVTERRPAGTPMPDNRMVFDGVAVGKIERVPLRDRAGETMLKDSGKPEMMIHLQADYTAERAIVDLYNDELNGRTYASMMLLKVAINDPASDHLVFVEKQPIKAVELPSLFEQKAKFMSLTRLQELAKDPEQSRRVRDAKRKLIDAVAGQALVVSVRNALAEEGELLLTNPQGDRYYVDAPTYRARGETLVLGEPHERQKADGRDGRDGADEPVEREVVVQLRVAGLVTRELKADWGELRVVRNDLGEEPRMNLVLKNVEVSDRASPTAGSLREVTLPLMQWSKSIAESMRGIDLAALRQRAESLAHIDIVAKSRRDLDDSIDKLMRNIQSMLHERAATAVLCLLVLLLGAVMSMMLRHQPPLAIFFWSFMPTIATYMAVLRGQSLMTWRGYDPTLGMAVIWTGNVLLAVALLVIYLRLQRN